MGLKNLLGDFLGYARCPVTGDTYWHNATVSVPYSNTRGVLVSERALTMVPKEQIAEKVMARAGESLWYERKYTLEQIISQIPEGCFRIPRR